MTYKEIIKITNQALDLIDILSLLHPNQDIQEIRYAIEDYINNVENEETDNIKTFMTEYPEVFKYGIETVEIYDIFNYLDDDELMEYLRKRYPQIGWGHEYIEHHWIRKIGED